ncbi:unnamed protein product [Protopolystoma xenopodis]|uniref:Uncharacterized protein n=1 Tax=Protopolystoma xenopodis TaxID=117903 RepID=A0A3S5BAA7_9PLAT|nr:unnamed protein product [Protopolystoma xenopodis]
MMSWSQGSYHLWAVCQFAVDTSFAPAREAGKSLGSQDPSSSSSESVVSESHFSETKLAAINGSQLHETGEQQSLMENLDTLLDKSDRAHLLVFHLAKSALCTNPTSVSFV